MAGGAEAGAGPRKRAKLGYPPKCRAGVWGQSVETADFGAGRPLSSSVSLEHWPHDDLWDFVVLFRPTPLRPLPSLAGEADAAGGGNRRGPGVAGPAAVPAGVLGSTRPGDGDEAAGFSLEDLLE